MMEDRIGLYEKAVSPKMTWTERMTSAKNAGFDFVEMSIDETDARLERLRMPRNERLELVRLGSELGIPIESICLSGHRKYPLGSSNQKIRERGMEIMERAIILAHDLGVRIIQIAGYDVYYEPSTDETGRLFEENLFKSVEIAAYWGITLGFETMETPFLNTVRKCMHYVSLVDSPWLQIYPDTGNMTNAALGENHDVIADLESGRGHISAMHLKETVPGKFREIPYGTGHVPFEELIRSARGMGVHRYTAELWCIDENTWESEIRNAYTFLTGRFPRSE